MTKAEKVSGLNHVTLAVSDLDRSLAFYRDLLGFTLRASWAGGAYLEAGSLWLCLSLDEAVRSAHRPDYSHVAFSVAEKDHAALSARLSAECPIWRDNRSEGASTYFLDPDGHKLELHVGTLETRLAHYRSSPDLGIAVFEWGRRGWNAFARG